MDLGGNLVAAAPDGTPLWTRRLTSNSLHLLQSSVSHVAWRDDVIITVGRMLRRVSADSGDEIWRIDASFGRNRNRS